ncbi:Lipase [Sergentomyia squamirostris]
MKTLQVIVLAVVLCVTSCRLAFGSENEIDNQSPLKLLRKKTVIEVCKDDGYVCEEHTAQTQDGYILTMHRIPPTNNEGQGIVFLQHGLLCSSMDWVVSGPGKSLAYLLADKGYDVWLGNARGNIYSRRHVSLDVKKGAFWQFSWHEIGIYDLPAMIDYSLNATGQKSLQYIGHSQGTTSFFVMASMREEYQEKVSFFQALAPAVFLSNSKSPLIRALAPFANIAKFFFTLFGQYEFIANTQLLELAEQAMCKKNSPFLFLCKNILFLLSGYDSEQLDDDLLSKILENVPAGASVGQIVHYAQSVNSGQFRQFFHGPIKNKVLYGNIAPPEYKLENVKVPTVIHYSKNDWISVIKDVEKLTQKLPNVVGDYLVPFPKFNHLDFIYAKDVKFLLYDKVIELVIENTENANKV